MADDITAVPLRTGPIDLLFAPRTSAIDPIARATKRVPRAGDNGGCGPP